MFPNATPSNDEMDADRVWRPSMLRLLYSGAVLCLLWFTLAGHEDLSSWIVGVPTVIAATWVHTRLSPRDGVRLSLIGGTRLIPFFLRESLMGGIDVARRVVGPRLNVAPGFLDYRLGLTQPSARVFFIDLVSLLPGTLSADVRGETLRIHALDHGVDPVPDLVRLEERVAALYGETLPNRTAPAP